MGVIITPNRVDTFTLAKPMNMIFACHELNAGTERSIVCNW